MAKLTSAELEELTATVEARALAILADASEGSVRDGMEWYWRANSVALVLAEKASVTTATAAAIIAALSPRVRWSANLVDASAILDGELDGFMALGSNIVKAWRILEGEHPSVILGGRKVRSFWQNIANPSASLDVTLDIHMLRALVPAGYWEHMNEPYNFLARVGVYDAVADGVRNAAEESVLAPHELQAIIWIEERGMAT
jgi:hypothetical protein